MVTNLVILSVQRTKEKLKKMRKQKKMTTERNSLVECATNAVKIGHMSNDYEEKKKNEKLEKSNDGDEGNMVLCLLTAEIQKSKKNDPWRMLKCLGSRYVVHL